MLDDEELVGALEQLVDRRAHRPLDDVDEVLGVDRLRRCRRRAFRGRAGCASRAGRARGSARRRRRRSRPRAAARTRCPRTSPCAHGHALIPVASTPTSRRVAVARGGGDADQRDHLLRRQPRHRRLALERVARGRPRPRRGAPAGRSTIVARDVLGELLDEQRLADHELVDRLLEELGEARHVHALLRGVEVDRAVDLREDELLVVPRRSRIALLTPVTPARDRPIRTSGSRGLEVGSEEVASAPSIAPTRTRGAM